MTKGFVVTGRDSGTHFEFPVDEFREAAAVGYERWQEPQRLIPIDRGTCLYHYTSAEGLEGILKTRSLRATDTAFLNDSKEISYAAEPLVKRMSDYAKKYLECHTKAGHIDPEPIDPEQLDPLLFGLKPGEQPYEHSMVLLTARKFIKNFACADRERIVESNGLYINGATFVACLSKEHDQLGQWRGYGRGGYAIGFLKNGLANAAPLGPVGYGGDAVDNLCDRVIQHFESRELDFGNYTRDGYVEAMSYCMPHIALVKHDSFKQENEWRLVVPRYDLHFEDIGVRVAAGKLVPYVECPFEESTVAEIVIGPGGDLHSVRAVRALLTANDYDPDKVKITHSNSPFRG